MKCTVVSHDMVVYEVLVPLNQKSKQEDTRVVEEEEEEEEEGPLPVEIEDQKMAPQIQEVKTGHLQVSAGTVGSGTPVQTRAPVQIGTPVKSTPRQEEEEEGEGEESDWDSEVKSAKSCCYSVSLGNVCCTCKIGVLIDMIYYLQHKTK